MGKNGLKLLKWKNFTNHIYETCKINYDWDRFADVTFIAQNRRFSAHRIVLSADSDFFKMILNEVPSCIHPTITLPDINYEDLEAIIKFIYTGELYVPPERFLSVLSLASCLQVKSLMEVQAALTKEEANKTVSDKMSAELDIADSSHEKQSKPISMANAKVKHSCASQIKKRDPKEYFKRCSHCINPMSTLTNIRNIQNSGGLEMRKRKRRGGSRGEIMMVGGKWNGTALNRKSSIPLIRKRKFIREKILRAFQNGGSTAEVAKLFNFHHSTAFYYKKLFVEAGVLSPSVMNRRKSNEKNDWNETLVMEHIDVKEEIH